MVPQPIKDKDELEAVLLQHTGSRHAIWDLSCLLENDRYTDKGDLYYKAYPRGKNTIVLKKSKNGLFLVDVFAKIIHTAWAYGIDYELLEPLISDFQAGAKMRVGWKGMLAVELVRPLNEQDIFAFFKQGWSIYQEFDDSYRRYHTCELKMK